MARCFSPASSAWTAARKRPCTLLGLAAPDGGADPARGPRRAVHVFKPLEVKEQLAADGIDHGAHVAEGEARAGAHQAGLSRGLAIPATAFIATIECRIEAAETSSSRRARNVLSWPSSGMCRSAAAESVLRAPTLQLVGTDLEDTQHVLTAIAGHS